MRLHTLKLLVTTVLLVCCHNGVFQVTGGRDNQNWTTLQLLQIVHNPGQSSPEETFPSDPNSDLLKRFGFGQLTNTGKTDELRLGQFLRKRYGDRKNGYIDELYKSEQLRVRSSDYDSYLTSASALLAGLYPPKGIQIWDSKLKWQPIPIHSVPGFVDILLAPTETIQNYSQIINTSKRKKFNRQKKDVYRYLTSVSGMEVNEAHQVTVIQKALEFADINRLIVAPWATDPELRECVKEISDADLNMSIDSTELQLFTSGVILNEIVRNMENKTKFGELDLRKINIYTTSDLVIAGLLSLISCYNGSRPIAGSAVIIELHLDPVTSQQFIQIIYRNVSGEFTNLSLPFCASPCSLQRLVDWTHKLNGQLSPGKFPYINLLSFDNFNLTNRPNREIITVSVTVSMTTIIVIGGILLICIAFSACAWAYCSRRRTYIRL